MKLFRSLFFILLACLPVLPCFAQQPGVVVVNASSKELRRAAHRLRIPVEQMKNARQTLQEATDLAKKLDPCPAEQFFNLAQGWSQLDKSRSKAILESLIQELRMEAASCADYPCYQRATSIGLSLMQSNSDFDYEKVSQIMRNWPEPKTSAGEAARSFKETMETQVKRQALTRLATSDPERAMALLPEVGDSNSYRYSASGQIAQGLMNAGKKEQALRLIDQTIQGFDQSTTDLRMLQDYENFVRVTAMNLDSSRASTAIEGLVNAYMNQNAGSCGATMKSGDATLDLTCAESRILNLVRGFPMRPGFTLKTIESVPGLKSKLDTVGGIDALYGGINGPGVSINYTTPGQGTGMSVLNAGIQPGATPAVNITKLMQELRGKDSAYVKSKLKDLGIDVLINLGMNAAYQDPDLGAIALEIAQQLLPQVEPLQKRASTLQNLVQAYRQVDGEVDPSLLKNGFVLADELRQELSEKAEAAGKTGPVIQVGMTQADNLEAFLVAELSRNSYESAIRYVHSMESNAVKLACMLQVVQALSQPNF